MLTTCSFDAQDPTKKPECKMNVIHQNTTQNETIKKTAPFEGECFTPALLTLICLIFLIIFEIWQVISAPLRFFRKSENWLDLMLVLSTAASLANLLHNDFSKAIKLDKIEENVGFYN